MKPRNPNQNLVCRRDATGQRPSGKLGRPLHPAEDFGIPWCPGSCLSFPAGTPGIHSTATSRMMIYHCGRRAPKCIGTGPHSPGTLFKISAGRKPACPNHGTQHNTILTLPVLPPQVIDNRYRPTMLESRFKCLQRPLTFKCCDGLHLPRWNDGVK
jgi:hypothetical protein